MNKNNELIDKNQNLNKTQYLNFGIAKEIYGLDLNKIKEIIRSSKITNVPNTAEFVMGVINLRGQIVPVIDMKKRLNLESERKYNDKRIIIVEFKNYLLGLMVDIVNEVITVNRNKIEELKETSNDVNQAYIKGVIKTNNNLIAILNFEKII